jgi:hypothetical protein
VLAGWDGTSTAVQVRITAGVLGPDPFTVLDSGGGTGVHLGTVQTNGDYVTTNAVFDATIVRSAAAHRWSSRSAPSRAAS